MWDPQYWFDTCRSPLRLCLHTHLSTAKACSAARRQAVSMMASSGANLSLPKSDAPMHSYLHEATCLPDDVEVECELLACGCPAQAAMPCARLAAVATHPRPHQLVSCRSQPPCRCRCSNIGAQCCTHELYERVGTVLLVSILAQAKIQTESTCFASHLPQTHSYTYCNTLRRPHQ